MKVFNHIMKRNSFIVVVLAALLVGGLMFSCGILGGSGNGKVKDLYSLKSFDGTIDNKKKFVLVDFWDANNTPSNMVASNFAVVSGELADKVVAASVDINQDWVKDVTRRYKIEGTPCFMLFENGLEVGRNVGYMTKEELRTWLGKYVK